MVFSLCLVIADDVQHYYVAAVVAVVAMGMSPAVVLGMPPAVVVGIPPVVEVEVGTLRVFLLGKLLLEDKELQTDIMQHSHLIHTTTSCIKWEI